MTKITTDAQAMAVLRQDNAPEMRRAVALDYLAARLASTSPAPEAVEGPTWTKDKPTSPGVYGVRGLNACVPKHYQFEAAVLVREYDDELVCNLHESTSNENLDDWSPLANMSDKFEWCRFNYVAAPTPEAK